MRRKPILIAGCVLAIVVLATAALPALRGFASAGADVPLHEVERGDFSRRVRAEGNLEAVDATVLGPPPEVRQPLKIAWLAQDGSPVKSDEVVIRFDPTEMEQNLREGRHDHAAASSRITQKQVRQEGSLHNLDRDAEMAGLELDYAKTFQNKDETIFSRHEIIEAEIDEELAGERKNHAEQAGDVQGELGQAEVDLLVIERRKAELKIEQAEQGLQKLEVRAPHDGIFVLKTIWGRKPEVGQMVWGGNAVAELPKLDRMEAKVYVLEADAGGLEVGLPATVTLDAHPGVIYQATVAKADALAQRRNRRVPIQYFGVTLELERTDLELMKPGQRVQAILDLEAREDVLTVPRQAVFEKDGRKIVYRRRGGEFEPQEVELGPTALGRVVIEKGVEEGDLVALRDPTRPLEETAPEEQEQNGAPGAR